MRAFRGSVACDSFLWNVTRNIVHKDSPKGLRAARYPLAQIPDRQR